MSSTSYSITARHLQSIRTLTLREDIGLNVSVVVLAGPHKGSGGLQHLGDHIVDQPMLVPDLQLVELRLVVPVVETQNMFRNTQTGRDGVLL